jgi:hypothetical protein
MGPAQGMMSLLQRSKSTLNAIECEITGVDARNKRTDADRYQP